MQSADTTHARLACGVDFRYDCGGDPGPLAPERAAAARRARIAQRIALEELWHQVVQAHSAVSH